MQLKTTLSCQYFGENKQKADSVQNFAESRKSIPNLVPNSQAMEPWSRTRHSVVQFQLSLRKSIFFFNNPS